MERMALTIKEAAEAIGVGVKRVNKLVLRGDIKAIKFGECETGRRIIPVDELSKWLSDHLGETIED